MVLLNTTGSILQTCPLVKDASGEWRIIICLVIESVQPNWLVAKYFTGNFLKVDNADLNLIVYGAQDGRQTSVMIMNTGFGEPKAYNLYLNNTTIKSGSGLNIVLQANCKKMYKDVIPKRSTQSIIFKGKSITKNTYKSDDFDNARSPVFQL